MRWIPDRLESPERIQSNGKTWRPGSCLRNTEPLARRIGPGICLWREIGCG
jgi:hypothetical protein